MNVKGAPRPREEHRAMKDLPSVKLVVEYGTDLVID